MIDQSDKKYIKAWVESRSFEFHQIFYRTMPTLNFSWKENIGGKGENVGYQHFLFFTHCFQKSSVWFVQNMGLVKVNKNMASFQTQQI